MNRDSKGRNIGYTNEEFIQKVKARLNYIEVLDEYKGAQAKVRYKCLKCGYISSARAGNLMLGHGCPICTHAGKIPHEEFVKRIKAKNPTIKILNKYNNSETLMECECRICKNKWQTKARNLSKGHGCPKCNQSNPLLTTEEYKKEIQSINPNVIVIGEYTGNGNKIACKCVICGYEWYPFASAIKSGHGCPNCKALNDRLSHEEFIKRMKDINPFVKIIGKYETNKIPLEVKCLVCGKTFNTKPEGLLKKTGCPYCNLSKGERDVSIFLDKNNIKYIQQKKYKDLIGLGGGKLAYDFYLPGYNLLIEYQGRQHKEPVKGFVEGELFEYVKEHDRRKKEYAERHNIQLLEIWYNENIEQKLKETLNLETVETTGV